MKEATSTPPGLWVGQGWNLLTLILLVPITFTAWLYIGAPQKVLFWICVAIPIIHQVYVWITWRLELKSGVISQTLGFRLYRLIFLLILISRPLTLLALAIQDPGSIGLGPILRIALCVVLAIPLLYTFYSVDKFFGIDRASGGDHFEETYRTMPLVRNGIFKYTNNAMYIFGFLLFWIMAIGLDSPAALIIAAYSHASIWMHYLATEKPNMKYLYDSP